MPKLSKIEKNNNVIVSHTSDLDGRISRELYVYYTGLPQSTPTVWVEYGELIEKAQSTMNEWATGKDVVVLDFSMTQQFVDEVARVAKSVKIVDHHTGTTQLVAPANTTIIVDTKESTVSLLQKHFTGQETVFTNICRDIDLNLVEKPEVLSHKLFLDSLFINTKDVKQSNLPALLAFYSQSRPFYIAKAEEQLKLAETLAKTALVDKIEKTASLLRADVHKGIDTDILAHHLLKLENVEFALISFDLVEDGIRITSVRKLKSCTRSLEEYCQARGGGGRETAGAFRESLADLNDDAFFTICGGLR